MILARRVPRHIWLGAALVLFAAAVRLPLAGWARFAGDEATTYSTAMDIAHLRGTPLLGPPIVGGQARLPGPLYYWMAALPQSVSSMPDAGNAFFCLLGVATVLLFWLMLRRPFGEAGAALAGFMMAFSPWCAFYSERVGSSMGPFLFLTVLAMFAALRLRDDPRSPWLVALLPAAAGLVQLHMSAAVVWLALLPLVLPSIRRWRPRWLILGMLLVVGLFVPLLVHELRSHGAAMRWFAEETFGNRRVAAANDSYRWQPLYVLRFLTLDVSFEELMGYWGGLDERRALQSLWRGSALRPFHPLRFAALVGSVLLVVVAVGTALRATIRRARTEGARAARNPLLLAAITALLANFALLAFTRKQIFAHYVSAVIPFVFVVFAALGRELASSRRWLRAATLALVLVFAAGGIDAAWSVKHAIDGRMGVATHKAVLRRIYADLDLSRPGTTVRLDQSLQGLRTSGHGYEIIARLGFKRPLGFSGSPAGLHYRLQDASAPPPSLAVTPPQRIGAATLYRLH